MKKILVTGGTGYVGRNLIPALLIRYPNMEVMSLSRSEGPICQLLLDCPQDRLKIIMADVRDTAALRRACQGVDTVIHLAAMKRVHLAEMECRETVSINVFGTINMLEAFTGSSFIHMSTDKAVEPINCYGASKLVAEKLVLEAARKRGNQARFMIIRCGNIMGSSGSVMEIWRHQIEKNNEVTITDPEMLRYYTSINEVVRLILAVLEWGTNGKVYFIPDCAPVPLKELVAQALKLYGNDKTAVRRIGVRPGERLAEKMYCIEEQDVIVRYEDLEEKYREAEAMDGMLAKSQLPAQGDRWSG